MVTQPGLQELHRDEKISVSCWGKTGVARFPSKTAAYLFTKIRVKIKWMPLQENDTDCLKTQVGLAVLMELTHWRDVSLYSALNYLLPAFLADAHPFSHHWKDGVSSCYNLDIVTNATSEFWVAQHLSNRDTAFRALAAASLAAVQSKQATALFFQKKLSDAQCEMGRNHLRAWHLAGPVLLFSSV